MSLQAKLDAFKAQFQSGQPPFDGVPPAAHEVMKRATEELIASGAAERARRDGRAPDFELTGADGEVVALSRLLERGPVVLTFYRGVWCPYCNIDLKALGASAGRIRDAGASLVSITPQMAINSRKTILDNDLDFPVLSDPGNAVAEAYGLRFRLPDELVALYKQLGVNLPAINGDPSWTLPMPARFVIDRQGQIRYAEVSPDYTRRAELDELLAVLAELTSQAPA